MNGKTETQHTGWEIQAIVGDDRAVGGKAYETYIIKADTKEEAIEEVRNKRIVLEVLEEQTEKRPVDEEGLPLPREGDR